MGMAEPAAGRPSLRYQPQKVARMQVRQYRQPAGQTVELMRVSQGTLFRIAG